MNNEQLAGARRAMRGNDGLTARFIDDGIRLMLNGSNRDVVITVDMNSSQVEQAMREAIKALKNG